jgi:hypothetical protein
MSLAFLALSCLWTFATFMELKLNLFSEQTCRKFSSPDIGMNSTVKWEIGKTLWVLKEGQKLDNKEKKTNTSQRK